MLRSSVVAVSRCCWHHALVGRQSYSYAVQIGWGGMVVVAELELILVHASQHYHSSYANCICCRGGLNLNCKTCIVVFMQCHGAHVQTASVVAETYVAVSLSCPRVITAWFLGTLYLLRWQTIRVSLYHCFVQVYGCMVHG